MVHVADLEMHGHEAFTSGLFCAVKQLLSLGIVHGDVTASNVVFNRETQLVRSIGCNFACSYIISR